MKSLHFPVHVFKTSLQGFIYSLQKSEVTFSLSANFIFSHRVLEQLPSTSLTHYKHIKLCRSTSSLYVHKSTPGRVFVHSCARLSCRGRHAGSVCGSAWDLKRSSSRHVHGFVMWTSLLPLPLVVVVMMYCVVACWLLGCCCCSRCSVWVWVVLWGAACFDSSSLWPSEIT